MKVLNECDDIVLCLECGDELHDPYEIDFEYCWICEQIQVDEFFDMLQTYYSL